MRDLCMLGCGVALSCALINGMQGDYLMMGLMIGLAVFNVEMGVRRG